MQPNLCTGQAAAGSTVQIQVKLSGEGEVPPWDMVAGRHGGAAGWLACAAGLDGVHVYVHWRCCQVDHAKAAGAVGVLCGGTGSPNGEPIKSLLGKKDVWYPIEVSSGMVPARGHGMGHARDVHGCAGDDMWCMAHDGGG